MSGYPLFRSLTFRLALQYLATFTLSVALLLGGAYWFGVIQPLQRVRSGVERETAVLTAEYAQVPRGAFIARLEQWAALPHRRDGYYALIDPDGQVLAANVPTFPAPRAQRDWLRFEFQTYGASQEEEEHEATARDITFVDGIRLIVGRDTEDIDERDEFLQGAAIWGSLLTVVLGALGGALMSLQVGQRIDAVTRAALRVIGGDLSGRVEVSGAGDDFDQLARTLNQMLARIEGLVESVSRVSDSIAHELRTPLARLRADLDTLSKSISDDPQSRRFALQALGEAERLQSIFDALLRIARIETGRHQAQLDAVDLSPLLADAVEFYQPEAQARGLVLTADLAEGLRVAGDRDLLFQAAANLLDNAIKFTPQDGGPVRLEGAIEDRTVVIAVSDAGAGVDDAHLSKLTERFFRTPAADAVQGFGLGLSLVGAVARLHGGELRFSNLRPGFRVELRIPSAD